jgi:dihydrofolate synthase/folylpolyglutamate synthase
MIAQVLSVSGYKTGLYTSPHFYTLRERIRVDGSLISEEEFAALMAEVKPYFEAINRDPRYRQLTFFEALTVLAFAYFKKKQADWQVLEVGLGGRLDATNVAKPEICIITSISLDHTEILGDTLPKIAYEKAGIIKPGCQVVLFPQTEEVSQVLSDVCCQRRASLVQVGKDVTWHNITSNLYQQSFTIEGKMGIHHITIPLLGDFQIENAATAVAALELLASSGCAITSANIARGLARVEWPGRFQILQHHPMVLVDGAHNVASTRRLVSNIKAYFNFGCHYEGEKQPKNLLVFGTSCDKDIPGMVKELVSLSPQVVVTSSSHPRAASPLAIAAEFAKQGIKPEVAENIPQALSQTLSEANEEDVISITGSLFVVAEALDYFSKA